MNKRLVLTLTNEEEKKLNKKTAELYKNCSNGVECINSTASLIDYTLKNINIDETVEKMGTPVSQRVYRISEEARDKLNEIRSRLKEKGISLSQTDIIKNIFGI